MDHERLKRTIQTRTDLKKQHGSFDPSDFETQIVANVPSFPESGEWEETTGDSTTWNRKRISLSRCPHRRY